jgi:hypothetical protein
MRLLLLLAVMGFATAALADVPPPDVSDCQSKAAGDACKTDGSQSGACQKQTCSRLDYSDGSPPSTVQYDCLKCVAGAAPAKSGGCAAAPGAALAALALLLAFRRGAMRAS